MPTKRGTSSLRPHSRSSSATRLGANLQFTTSQHKGERGMVQQQQKPPSRILPAQRVQSREHISAHPAKRVASQQAAVHQHQPKPKAGNKSKPGFTLTASHSDPSDDDDDDNQQVYDEGEGDDDEWVSSESGVQTPNSQSDGSDPADRELDRRREEALRRLLTQGDLGQGAAAPSAAGANRTSEAPDVKGATAATPQAGNHVQLSRQQQQDAPKASALTRVDTAKQNEIIKASGASAQMLPPASNGGKLTIDTTSPTPPTSSNARSPAPSSQSNSSTNPNSPRPRESSRRSSASTRPGSVYTSRHSTGDVTHGQGHPQPLRPHPLIRGHSFGIGQTGKVGQGQAAGGGIAGLQPLTPKHAPLPSQLQPLTVIQDAGASMHGSPTDDGHHHHQYLSASPTGSIQTVLTSPGSPERDRSRAGNRRTSVSSVHSTMTLPIQSSTWSLPGSGHDRKRTTSTLSHSSSTAALSSLASAAGTGSSGTLYPSALSSLTHLPSVTRPPSPQAISFFPPMNTQVRNEIEKIHPLLPPPYIGNHLAVLARRTPIWESWERVGRARREMRTY